VDDMRQWLNGAWRFGILARLSHFR
jgi:hypothetical protein